MESYGIMSMSEVLSKRLYNCQVICASVMISDRVVAHFIASKSGFHLSRCNLLLCRAFIYSIKSAKVLVNEIM